MKKSNKGLIPKAMMAVGTITAAFFITGAPMIVKAAPEDEAEEVVCTCSEKCDEDHVNEECEVCKYDYTYCQATEPVRTVEYVDEDGNPIEKPENFGPLTPDGNMDIVDDYGSLEVGGKQFITVVTKSGHYFYIIIDRDDKGNETVHFLNKVDEADLLALMEDDEVKEYEAEVKAKEDAETETVEEPKEEEKTNPFDLSMFKKDKEPKTEKKIDKSKLLPVAAVVLVLIGVGGFMLLKKKKTNKPKKAEKDPDEDYNEEDYLESLPDEEEEDDFDIPDEIPDPDEEDNE